eukprot:c2840_g1_i1.p1 GENE.c2840_g1_i1~~c2840_g1_i1.p1  ORF type:complete len:242 (-),score=43.61 c2840_g1_i1:51-734(-)
MPHPDEDSRATQHSNFSPYVNNGGTVIAVAGKDFCVVAADTRLSQGYSILSRYSPKTIELTPKCVLASSGMQADRAVLFKVLRVRAEQYMHAHNRLLSTEAFAQLLSTTLYSRRFFPYYTFNVIAGLDEKGVGCVYSYDAVGTLERVQYSVSGSGSSLVQPLLDNQVGPFHSLKSPQRDLSCEEVVELVKDAMASAGERDIYTGDSFDLCIINAQGVHRHRFPLRLD